MQKLGKLEFPWVTHCTPVLGVGLKVSVGTVWCTKWGIFYTDGKLRVRIVSSKLAHTEKKSSSNFTELVQD